MGECLANLSRSRERSATAQQRPGEGCGAMQDLVHDAVDILVDQMVCEAHHIPAAITQKILSSAIVCALLSRPMRRAVDLHDEQSSDVREIRDVWPDGVLATKLEAMNIGLAQSRPQNHFWLCHLLAEFSCASSRLRLVFAHCYPSPDGRVRRPLPQAGEVRLDSSLLGQPFDLLEKSLPSPCLTGNHSYLRSVPPRRGRSGSFGLRVGSAFAFVAALRSAREAKVEQMDATTPEADGPELPWSRRALHGAHRKVRVKSVSRDRKSPGAGCLASHFPPLLRRSGKPWTARRRGVPRHLFFNRRVGGSWNCVQIEPKN